MNNSTPLKELVAKFPCNTVAETRFALLQTIQELTIGALFRANFFSLAAFYGGTALRIFHSLPRFSEDLDFSLIKPSTTFSLDHVLPKVEEELWSFGLEASITTKEKNNPVQFNLLLSKPIH